MSSRVISLLVALTLFAFASATTTTGTGQTWAGCGSLLPSDAVRLGPIDSGLDCAATCQSITPSYQYAFAYQTAPNSISCYCGNTAIAIGSYVGQNEATCLTAGDYSQYITSVDYVFQDCADGGWTGASDTQTDFANCLIYCGSNTPTLFHTNNGQCFCEFDSQQVFSTCSNVGYAYIPGDSYGQASALSRRRRRYEALAKTHLDARRLCPSGLSACRVATGSDAYECIDTESELESCGGCLLGEILAEQRFTSSSLQIVNTAPQTVNATGVDCTAFGGSFTCAGGLCKPF